WAGDGRRATASGGGWAMTGGGGAATGGGGVAAAGGLRETERVECDVVCVLSFEY
ncbi:hypothetical protein Tco_0671377, partial [Tanacetum coccineum]